MRNVGVIILNWNGFEDTLELLHSLQQVKSPLLKVFVVDNNSSSNDAEKLESKFKSFITVIRSKNNLGFAGGNNLGIKNALEENIEFILLINNDTTIKEDFLEHLLLIFSKFEQAGIVAPQINYYDEPNKIWTSGGYISAIRASGFAYSDKIDNRELKIAKEVGFVSGCCMLIRRNVFETIGLFDEKYFLYVEDSDFCHRVIKVGYKIFLNPNAVIYHKVGMSTNKYLNILPLYYTTRNRLYFAKKNFKDFYYFSVTYVFTVMLIKGLSWIFQGKIQNVRAIIQAFKDFFSKKMGRIQNENLLAN